MLPPPRQVALAFAQALDSLAIGYFLGGSLASSIQGEPRATNDIDFVVDLRAEQVAALGKVLGPDFDVDEESLRDAARQKSSCEGPSGASASRVRALTHLPWSFGIGDIAHGQHQPVR